MMKRVLKSLCCVLVALFCAGGAMACSSEESDPEALGRGEKIFMIGDSLFDFWKDTCLEDLGTNDVFNMAISGTTSEYWIENIGIVDKQVERISKSYDVTGMVISLGTNDIYFQQDGQQAAEGENGLQDLLELLHEKYPDMHIWLLTVNLCGETVRWGLRDEVRECNTLMRAYCEPLDWAEMVETETAFYDDTNYEEKPSAVYFQPDYLHFSESGYKVLAGILREALGLQDETA